MQDKPHGLLMVLVSHHSSQLHLRQKKVNKKTVLACVPVTSHRGLLGFCSDYVAGRHLKDKTLLNTIIYVSTGRQFFFLLNLFIFCVASTVYS